jgi:hypothetical protein
MPVFLVLVVAVKKACDVDFKIPAYLLCNKVTELHLKIRKILREKYKYKSLFHLVLFFDTSVAVQ